MSAEILLEVEHLNKYFGPTHANNDVSFSLKKGEVKALMGENGSGKSTLISQIAGIHKTDGGCMMLAGVDYHPHNAMEANRKGVAMVVQELGVIGNLPVGVNMFLGRTDQFSKAGIVSIKKLYNAANEQFEQWQLPRIPLNKLTAGLNIETRKMIELARALSNDPQLLLLDEITQSLSLNFRNKLYDLIEKFKSMGRSIILISHDIEESIQLSDSLIVLRDGEIVCEAKSANITPDELKSKMVGRKILGSGYYRSDNEVIYGEDILLRVSDLTVEKELEDISFDLHKGEILGFCGLSDSGIHEIGKAVYGLSKVKKGTVELKSRNITIKTPMSALKNGMAYVPKDRDNEALFINDNILFNMCLPSFSELSGLAGFVDPKKEKSLANKMCDSLSVKCTGITQKMSGLSGGNKQKVNLGRWLAKDLDVIVLDCPTRGVDVGVKSYIYNIMKELKEKGLGMILISDELTEVLGMSDRLNIMKEGRIVSTICRNEDFTEHSVIGKMI